MDNSDGRRLTSSFLEGREIVILSERIVPRVGMAEDHPTVRYFWFVVLHEVAHAIRLHQAPAELDEVANNLQEIEANNLALAWFNRYLADCGEVAFTTEELMRAQVASRLPLVQLTPPSDDKGS